MTNTDDPNPLAERIAASVRETIDTDNDSRRGFLGRTALAGGTLLALGGGTGMALAQEGGNGATEGEMKAMFDDVEGTDIDVLNYALTLERLEDAFYQEALDMFGQDDFVQADPLQSFSEEQREAAFGYVQSVAEHEATHVEVLSQAVTLLGGEPAEEASYTFGVESVNQFLQLGTTLENTGVAAYAGAAPFIQSPDLAGAALSIHSVEARHAAYLNQLNGQSPFPNAFDEAKSQEAVLDAVSPLIDSSSEGGDTETATPSGNESE